MNSILPATKYHIEYANTSRLDTVQCFPALWHHWGIPSLPAVLVCNTKSARYRDGDYFHFYTVQENKIQSQTANYL